MSNGATTAQPFIEHGVRSRKLVSQVSTLAPAKGGNRDWAGLLFHRCVQPVEPRRVNLSALSLRFVLQGSMAVIVDGDRATVSGPLHCVVLTRRLLLQATVLDASPTAPFLSPMLRIDPGIVRRLSADLIARHPNVLPPRSYAAAPSFDAGARTPHHRRGCAQQQGKDSGRTI